MSKFPAYKSPVADEVPFNNDGNGFNSEDTQSAIEEAKQNAEGFPRAGIPLINNGTQGGGDWISYSNLTPNVEIIFPVKTKLNELTWGNSRDNVTFDLEIYKNGTTSGDLVRTLSITSSVNIKSGFIDTIDETFEAGDWIRIKYISQGTNTSDLVVLLWISRIAE